MDFYYANGTCALGIHVLLEDIGNPYKAIKLDFATKQQSSPEFLALNPKGKVPTLRRDDGRVLTEFPAIAVWLARTNPEKGLLPENADALAEALEVMDYVVSSVHMQGFSRIVRPENFAPSEADHEAVRAKGRDIFERGLDLLDARLGGNAFIVGDRFSVADAALFYVEFWQAARLKLPLPANLAKHYDRLRARSSFAKIVALHGF